MFNVVMLSIISQKVIMLNVIMLSVAMVNVVMLKVAAPRSQSDNIYELDVFREMDFG